MPTAAAYKLDRIPALDFTKGALVLIMVFYHWLNYFVSTEGDVYKYLRFLTPSFIFITGFLISHVYQAADQSADSRVPQRLMQRGLKLLAVFLFLNAAKALLIPDARTSQIPAQALALKDWVPVLVTGNVSVGDNSRATAFNILVPISYLLLLSAGFVAVSRYYRYAFHVGCLVLFLCILVLRTYRLEYGNLELIAIGMLGTIVGYIPMERIIAYTRHTYLLAAAYLGYVIAITVLNVTYPLQIVGVFLSLMIIVRLGEQPVLPGQAQSCIVRLGKYSLFGYIAQIAILQVLYRLLRSGDLGGVALGISFIAAFALTIATVVMLDHARAKLDRVDRLYKAIFA